MDYKEYDELTTKMAGEIVGGMMEKEAGIGKTIRDAYIDSTIKHPIATNAVVGGLNTGLQGAALGGAIGAFKNRKKEEGESGKDHFKRVMKGTGKGAAIGGGIGAGVGGGLGAGAGALAGKTLQGLGAEKWKAMADAVEKAQKDIKHEAGNHVKDSVKGAAGAAADKVKGAAGAAADKVKGAAGAAADKVKGVFNKKAAEDIALEKAAEYYEYLLSKDASEEIEVEAQFSDEEIAKKAFEILEEAQIVKQAAFEAYNESQLYAEAAECALKEIGYTLE